jgi:hypothetical protein
MNIATCSGGCCVTYKTVSRLDDWIYWHLIHAVWNCGQYSAIAILHTLQFTVAHALGFSNFTIHILATDLPQSHCNFKSHMTSYCHSLIPFLPFLLNHIRLPSPELDPIIDNWLKRPYLSLHNTSARTTQKTASLLLRRLLYWSVA